MKPRLISSADEQTVPVRTCILVGTSRHRVARALGLGARIRANGNRVWRFSDDEVAQVEAALRKRQCDPARTERLPKLLVPVGRQLGLGQYVPQTTRLSKHTECGWFWTPEEAAKVRAYYDEHLDEYEKKRSAALGAHGIVTGAERKALKCFENELADPLSHRTPEEAWDYACRTYGFKGTMPAVDVQRASRDALLVASATSRNIDRREAYRSCAPTGTVRPA